MGWRAKPESLEHVAKLTGNLLFAESHDLKHSVQRLGFVIANTAAARFKTVQNQIILRGKNFSQMTFFHEPVHVFGFRRRKRIMTKGPLLRSLGASKCRHPPERRSV